MTDEVGFLWQRQQRLYCQVRGLLRPALAQPESGGEQRHLSSQQTHGSLGY